MSRIKTKERTRYTANDDAYILECIEQHGVSNGAYKAAVLLGRTRSGVEQHYYSKLKGKKHMTVTGPATIEVNSQAPVPPATPVTKTDSDVKSVKFTVKGVEIYMTFK